ncbi:MAG: glycoside hydrolase family 88 protein [Bacteroidetes bacterium]|nr:glycoside hydrolase family 88 protein [Bacteroidota bacterium]MBU1114168.1 glycoside hydrolase family 88 protein [Bacteroidota bacterium]MBU1800124.1 glycoside hydrolase family 88 protein [Bacteroidota bacterium]
MKSDLLNNSIKILVINFLIIIISCSSPSEPQPQDIEIAKALAIKKLLLSSFDVPENQYPIFTNSTKKWVLTTSTSWTSGFYPGCLWYGYKLSGNAQLKNMAEQFTQGLFEEQYTTSHHDVGFMIFNSYGLGYKITGNESYKNVILQAAKSLSTRFNENVGCIQSWNGEFQVIIDNMMNLELLFWASKNGGDSTYYKMAVSHANKTIQNHIREDGSSFHVVHYDPETGDVMRKRTAQGYSDNSTWARGQAWGIYGFTMCYRETGNIEYLNTAVKMADYYISHLPEDSIPYWDFNLPENYERDFKDASAATIALSGLIELNSYVNSSTYENVINNTFNSLINYYIITESSKSGIIDHCAYHANDPNPDYWDSATIWGDYYFLEALDRINAD